MVAPADLPLVTVDAIDKVYPADRVAAQGVRWNNLVEDFKKTYGYKPTCIVRAPGRVNLIDATIGEHIDHALFGVVPMAIVPDVIIAVGPRNDTKEIRTSNVDKKYGPTAFTPSKNSNGEAVVDIDIRQLQWHSYVKAALLGYLKHPHSGGDSIGLDLLYDGTVPAGSGLSSSAAMVISSLLAMLTANGKVDGLTKGDLVKMSMGAEGNVGVNTGGMDQAASVISTPAAALYVQFYPNLAGEPVPIPKTQPEISFVIANTLVTSDKATTAKFNYNLRVVETLAGASLLAKRLGMNYKPKDKVAYRQVVSDLAGGEHSLTGAGVNKSDITASLRQAFKDALDAIEKHLGNSAERDGLTEEELIAALGISKEEFAEIYLKLAVEPIGGKYRLHIRAKHILEEALRVLEFRKTIETETESLPKALGEIMNKSQESCRDQFGCSCKEIDEITSIALEEGALGSRLTGAGWGGSTVSLVPAEIVPQFIANVSKRYSKYQGLPQEQLDQAIFATLPSSGACETVHKI
ncbi:Galactokinase [Wallemia mellicola]|nr:Galactokinase [Wallemia mellicola]